MYLIYLKNTNLDIFLYTSYFNLAMTTIVQSPTNIAVIKYWGKNPNWENEHIPTKSSISFMVQGLYSETKIEANEGNGKFDLTLNGQKFDSGSKEFNGIKQFINKICLYYPRIKEYNYNIISKNNFPTAAGFASSASGFSALAKAIDEEINLGLEDKELSVLARLGSGSAARSIPKDGGLVLWHRGIDEEIKSMGLTNEEYLKHIFSSYAETIIPAEELSELSIIYISVSEEEKFMSSRAGMKQTIKTNPVYWKWVDYEEYELMPAFLEAIKSKNWDAVFDMIIQASNGLHAMMLYTQPPIIYLNDISKYIINEVLELKKEIPIAYTFDAGPNPVVFTLKKYTKNVIDALNPIVGNERIFPTSVGPGPRVIK